MDVKIEYKLWKIRNNKGISIRHLAEMSGVSKSTSRISLFLSIYTIVSDISDIRPKTLKKSKFRYIIKKNKQMINNSKETLNLII